MKFLVQAGRRGGKTTELIQYAAKGHTTSQFPFWSRVIITTTVKERDDIAYRFISEHASIFGRGEVPPPVYTADEWARRCNG